MAVSFRNYKLLQDFEKVSQFLRDVYSFPDGSPVTQPSFEYAHTHPAFNHHLAHRFGLWEDKGQLVALVCFEGDIGEAMFSVKPAYEQLLPDMLQYAELELAAISEEQHSLDIYLTSTQLAFINLLQVSGYQKVFSEAVHVFSYKHDFPTVSLPEGYTAVSLEEENDLYKIDVCMWKGFNHADDPDDNPDRRRIMQTGPHFRPDLTTVIKAPNGDYACYAGIWLEEQNRYAYLEPLCTVPAYRRMGLAAYALVNSMQKTKRLGAKYCYGGSASFYKSFGFEEICQRETWRRKW